MTNIFIYFLIILERVRSALIAVIYITSSSRVRVPYTTGYGQLSCLI